MLCVGWTARLNAWPELNVIVFVTIGSSIHRGQCHRHYTEISESQAIPTAQLKKKKPANSCRHSRIRPNCDDTHSLRPASRDGYTLCVYCWCGAKKVFISRRQQPLFISAAIKTTTATTLLGVEKNQFNKIKGKRRENYHHYPPTPFFGRPVYLIPVSVGRWKSCHHNLKRTEWFPAIFFFFLGKSFKTFCALLFQLLTTKNLKKK